MNLLKRKLKLNTNENEHQVWMNDHLNDARSRRMKRTRIDTESLTSEPTNSNENSSSPKTSNTSKQKDKLKINIKNDKAPNQIITNLPSISIKTVGSDQKKATKKKILTQRILQNQSRPSDKSLVPKTKRVKFKQTNTILNYLKVRDKNEFGD